MLENTVNEIFFNRVARYGDRIAVEKRLKGIWHTATWNEYYDRARAAGLGLRSLGVGRGQRVSIISDNRLEWLYADMGALGIGACVVPIYPTLSGDDIGFILENSESPVVVAENKDQVRKVMESSGRCPNLKYIVVMEDCNCTDDVLPVMSFDRLLEIGRNMHRGNPELFEELAVAVSVDDCATIAYTSGTTGLPKGAMISHGNIVSVIRSLHAIEPHFASDADCTVPFLPLSHVFERIAGHFYGMYCGITASYAENVSTLLEDFELKRPTMILAVPRVCEKVYHSIMAQVREQHPLLRRAFFWGQSVGESISRYRERRVPAPLMLRLKYRIAYALIFRKLRSRLGGRVKWMTASGAPTAEEIVRFFNAAGITVIQGYGMTETTAPATMQSLSDYRVGTTGKPIPGCDIKIADDGEILIKGGNVFMGYWRQPEETADAFTTDGYLKSGDIGMLDDEGNLIITDRKKDIIITSGGKNIAPQKIENLFKTDPLFSQFIVIGENKKHLAALCTINQDEASRLAREENIECREPQQLLDCTHFLEIVRKRVADWNARLAKYETIKAFRIVKHEFTQEGGELTPSLKVRRSVVQQKYKDLIDDIYGENTVFAPD